MHGAVVCQVQRHSVTADTPDFAVRYDVLRERREHFYTPDFVAAAVKLARPGG